MKTIFPLLGILLLLAACSPQAEPQAAPEPVKELETIHTDQAPKAVGPYSQAQVVGDMVFCAGQIALDPATRKLVEGDITVQTERVLKNLEAVLLASGSDLDHVMKTTVFLADINDFQAMNAVYRKVFGDHKPARSTVAVADLALGALLEIECIALRK